MSLGLKLVRNDIAPKLTRLAKISLHPEKTMRAMGTAFLSITMGNFNDAGAQYRPTPWAPKKDGTPSKLQKSGTLARSFHLTVSGQVATVASPVVYAAIHQFGGTTKPHVIRPKFKKALAFGGKVYGQVNHPGSKFSPRPFFPVDSSGRLTPAAEKLIHAAGLRELDREMQA